MGETNERRARRGEVDDPPPPLAQDVAVAGRVGEVGAAERVEEIPAVQLEPAERPRPAARTDWRRLFAAGSPREVLARLVDGDPLGLRTAVAEGLRRGAFLMDADRLHLRVLARCARAAPSYRGRPPLSEWLAQLVDDSLLDVLREDAEEERAGSTPDAERLAAYRELARPLGFEPAAMRAACVVFNALHEGERKAFFSLVIDGHSLDDAARDSKRSATELARAARTAFDALLASPGIRPAAAARKERGGSR